MTQKILVVDSHPVLRFGLKELLFKNGFLHVDEASSVEEAVKIQKLQNLDLIIGDVLIAGGSFLEWVKDLKRQGVQTKFLVFSNALESDFGFRCMKAGAKGFLHKSASIGDFWCALRAVSSNSLYFSNETLQKALKASQNLSGEPPHLKLSDRELSVLLMIGQDRSLTEISLELGLSLKTVSTYKTRILKKMSMSSNLQIFRYVHKHGLLSTVDALAGD